jgi:ElaB/YqjD/DUF883 family membrane-anchored ribosome-binding protein
MNADLSSGLSDNGSNQGSTGVYDDAPSCMRQSGSDLRSDLASLKSDLDQLMSHASTLTDRELHEARDKLMQKFGSMQNTAKGLASEASKQITHGVDITSEYVKDRPLQSVAIATGVGLLLGAVLRRH